MADRGAGVHRLGGAYNFAAEALDLVQVREGLLQVAAEAVVAVGDDRGDRAVPHQAHEPLDAFAGEGAAGHVQVLHHHHGPPGSLRLRAHAREEGVDVSLLQLGGDHLLARGGDADVGAHQHGAGGLLRVVRHDTPATTCGPIGAGGGWGSGTPRSR